MKIFLVEKRATMQMKRRMIMLVQTTVNKVVQRKKKKDFSCEREDEAGDRNKTIDEDVSSEHSKVSGTEERRDEDFSCEREDEAGDRNNTSDEDEDEDVSSEHSKVSGTEERRDEDFSCEREDEAGDRNNTSDEDEDEDVSSEHSKVSGTEERRDEDFSCEREDEAGDRNNTSDEDEDEDVSSEHSKVSGTEERRDEDFSCEREDEAGDRNSNNGIASVNDDDSETEKWRKTKPGPKRFVVAIKTKTWKKIKPRAGSSQLQPPWTDVLYEAFSKAVTQGFSKQTGDYAVKEYATYCFGLLLNSTNLQQALNIFQDMSMLFMSANNSNEVVAAKRTLDEKILKSKPITVDEPLTTYVEDMESSSNIKTICGKSPFTHLFKSVLEKTSGSPKQETIDQQEEQWAKRSLPERAAKHRSKYFNPPEVVPQPKKKKTKQTSEDHAKETSAQIQTLWSKKACEIVVAVTQSKDKKRSFILHHSELKSLQPHEWLKGETIQCYFQVLVNNCDQGQRIYILDHYTAGVIIHGARDQIRRNSLSKMAKEVVGAFPNIPCNMTVDASKQHMEHLRLTIAEELLKASGNLILV
ncbi:hypothetical protein IRJ41_005314 [Triplophysa rosa]|uniref:Uncharacterized protein n=1 Tax=Triplophysa rosa TaxID=992332 RepID=A0A9W7T407_TRIRA|nr:hypothetical protein IRJ41_005314 [Triplophysa rosa]